MWMMAAAALVALAGCAGTVGDETGGERSRGAGALALQPGDTVTLSGVGVTASASLVGEGGLAIEEGPFTGEIAATAGADEDGELNALEITGAGNAVSFDEGNATEIDLGNAPTSGLASAELEGLTTLSGQSLEGSQTVELVVGTDAQGAFEHMAFGNWAQSGEIGAIFTYGAAGVETPLSGMPLSGVATYAGAAIGGVVLADTRAGVLQADVSATVDFSEGSFLFETSNSRVAFGSQSTLSPDASYDMRGSGPIEGTIATGALEDDLEQSGAFEARFFGPGAEEAGGVFDIVGSSRTVIGSFGAKRVENR